MCKIIMKRNVLFALLLLSAWTGVAAQENLDIYLCIG